MKRFITLLHFCLPDIKVRDFALLNLLFFYLLNSLPAQNEGNLFFRDTVHEIRFKFNQTGYCDSLVANKPGEVFMKCNVTIDGILFADAGVRFKGNSSYNNSSTKKPFKIDLEEFIPNRKVDGQDQFSLNNGFKDPTFLREKLMLDFCNRMGIPAPRATFARLYINDQFWGLYTVVEDISKTFLKQRFGNKSGNLYKGDPRGSLTWKGWDAALYKNDYELKTNEDVNDWSGLIAFLNVLNNTASNRLPDSLATYLNVRSWFSYWAVHSLFTNLDSYLGTGHNYYLYQNKDTGLFEFITWDVNEAFGNFKLNLTQQQLLSLPYDFIPQPASGRPIMSRLLPITAYRQQLASRACDLLQHFNSEKMDSRIDNLANLIRPHVYEDTRKFYSNIQFEQNLTQELSGGILGLKTFIPARRASLFSQLTQLGCVPTATKEKVTGIEIEIFPNPSTGVFWLKMDNTEFTSLCIFGVNGNLYQKLIRPAKSDLLSVDLSHLKAGLYLLRFDENGGNYSYKKLVLTGR